ncbi:MAG: Tetratricopeptide repeat-containing protein [Gemmatimonadetes bacterium]|nr:Tetratricopeptide repeat-containing protein [Gemmatimonadota bacterium]
MKRIVRALSAAALLPLLAGCLATQRDVRDLRAELDQVRGAQDRQTQTLAEIQRQAQRMLDSLSSQNVRSKGDLANRLLQIERQLVQVQELTGQGQQQVAQLRQQLNQRAQELARQQQDSAASADTPAAAPATAQPSGPAAASGSAEDAYNAGLAAYRRGSLLTARAGFEEYLRGAPQGRFAADAQLYVAETYAQGRDPARAVEAFARVAELYPASPRAATAVYRQGQVELARGNRAAARAAFTRVVRAYPRAPEAVQARQELARLGTG